MKKRVYIAGKMTGIPFYNYPKFMEAKAYVESQGEYEVYTPFDADNLVWQKHYGRDFDPYTDTCEYGDPKMLEMFTQDLNLCLAADIVALLDDWTISRGAKAEVVAAFTVGKEFRCAMSMEHLKITPDIVFTVDHEGWITPEMTKVVETV